MINRKLGINTNCLYGIADEIETMKLAREVGFEAMTTTTIDAKSVEQLKEQADKLGVDFPFLHAPYAGINYMWTEGEDYRKVYDGTLQAIDSAAANGVSGVVIHVSSGWQCPPVNDLGLSRFDALVEHAAKKGVLATFENLRMLGNLACLIDRYDGNPAVGYCYDCGHEHCYTKTVSWLDIFTNKLTATHIHDNMGRPFEDRVTDRDTHWLPLDGTFNYHEMIRKMDLYGYTGPLVLEVTRHARADYKAMTAEEFIKTCYDRLSRISKF